MAAALVDTTVLYAVGNRRTHRHDEAIEIVRSADRGDLPQLRIPDHVLVETMNGLTRDVGHTTAVDMLGRFRSGTAFDVSREPDAVWSSGIELFERHERLSLADALTVASARHHEIEHLYSFDDDFDGLDGVSRLTVAVDPFEPDSSRQ